MKPILHIHFSSSCKVFLISALFCTSGFAYAQTLEEQNFKNQLGGNLPIKLLRYTEIDCKTGNQRHFLGAIETSNFFLREYELDEDPTSLISLEKMAQSPNFFGQYNDQYWQINGAFITESHVSDPVSNTYKLGAERAKRSLNSILNFGESLAIPGTFVWKQVVWKNGEDKTALKAEIQKYLQISRSSTNGETYILTNLTGYIDVTNGFVSAMHILDEEIHYEYTTNWHVPVGIPTKITVGKNDSDCRSIFLIQEFVYGQPDDAKQMFDPIRKFSSADIATIVLVTNGARRVFGATAPPMPGMSPMSVRREPEHRAATVRLLMASITIISIVVIFFTFRKGHK